MIAIDSKAYALTCETLSHLPEPADDEMILKAIMAAFNTAPEDRPAFEVIALAVYQYHLSTHI